MKEIPFNYNNLKEDKKEPWFFLVLFSFVPFVVYILTFYLFFPILLF